MRSPQPACCAGPCAPSHSWPAVRLWTLIALRRMPTTVGRLFCVSDPWMWMDGALAQTSSHCLPVPWIDAMLISQLTLRWMDMMAISVLSSMWIDRMGTSPSSSRCQVSQSDRGTAMQNVSGSGHPSTATAE